MKNELQNIPSERPARFSAVDYIKITVFGFAFSALWGSFHSIVLPLRLLDFVSESQKNTFLALLTFIGLILAMIVQPIAGANSDRSAFTWGRRRPYILSGAGLAILLIPGIALSQNFLAILIVYCLLQVTSNIAQGPYQAFIPDLVPGEKRGRASGVKGFMETFGGFALLYPVAVLMDRYSTTDRSVWLWITLGILMAALFVATAITALTVREEPGRKVAGWTFLLSPLVKPFQIDIRANRLFLWFLASRLLFFMSFATIQTFALYFIRDVVGTASPAETTAKFYVVAAASTLAAVYPAGFLSDRVGRLPLAFSSGLIAGLGILLVFLFRHSENQVLIGSILVGIGFGTFIGSDWALAVDLVPSGEAARYLGLTNLATAGGAALARYIGPVIDFFNSVRPQTGYSVMLLACLIYFLVGSALLLKLRTR